MRPLRPLVLTAAFAITTVPGCDPNPNGPSAPPLTESKKAAPPAPTKAHGKADLSKGRTPTPVD
jgi:hypothetical protein